MKLVITGGAGYIGSHMVRLLAEEGHECVVFDNLSTGHAWAVDKRAKLVPGDLSDAAALRKLLTKQGIDAVLHFAASIVVPESVTDPLRYYRNNTANTLQLLETCVDAGIDKFIFSSTAAVYGNGRNDNQPLKETDRLAPINPYGNSKMLSEKILADLATTRSLSYVSLRYFNVAGAQPDGSLGQATPEATHLIKAACEAALGKRAELQVFGTDYPTYDGTCIRDYIHVMDLVQAHLLALNYLVEGGQSQFFNCGYDHGSSVREVIDLVSQISCNDFLVRDVARRAGDPAILTANSDKLQKTLNWTPKYNDLKTIIEHAWQWEQKFSSLPADKT